MKIPRVTQWLPIALTLFAGCAAPAPENPTLRPCGATNSAGSGNSFHYQDPARGFSLCLPAGLKKTAGTGPDQPVTFSGLAVPKGTNLETKTLVIASGKNDLVTGASAATSFKGGGLNFQRFIVEDGSAGHSTMHVIYAGHERGKDFYLDFTHRAVNVLNFDPPNRPKEYNRAAQIKLTEEIMSTFRKAGLPPPK
ncbi:MAG TPA: hypothetical protein VGO11_17315 [Chthoniobacteraceae bacterium]|jgi:hypothetical protein|nr:hypothetical protein [Chthoniobacteraceae bacterium]